MRKTTSEGGRNKTVHKPLETTNVHHGWMFLVGEKAMGKSIYYTGVVRLII